MEKINQEQQSNQQSLVDRIKTTLLGRYVALALVALTAPSCSPTLYTPKAAPSNNSTIGYINALVKIANEDCDEVSLGRYSGTHIIIRCMEYVLTKKNICTEYASEKDRNYYWCGDNKERCIEWKENITELSLDVRWSLDLEEVANMKVLEYNLLHHYEIIIALTTTHKSTLSLGFKSNNLGKRFADIIHSYLSNS